ncbi:gamma-glutamyltransferase [Bradyrhizobium sp. WBOS7]|uniref:Gamma-glutamyltransferase n=1 Tax=Bradyrhizobium betae TaxID=244734 RepID=A0AAE9N4N2_9BRAD|nr:MULTISPECIES: gamma-glutamyltransferase [Bradyrhizobium]MDD1572850.1 gamma-glutamyltransferase [Bradyrhizobium sp. WBOS1]UUO33280.1 gamma-glutamyltransferase [Bradyrhizobium sp. WBOS01]MDD1529543.1 gamma-glutamyltransferase [Bradyrhizobium sp. WBOS2]MDD1579177.1 gamma-glutamyltransferase [Bradyrhizobium sp. WBOS7]MDD1601984.1 gamma-glutamyltransferase [Bradyrhizobium sp. WBOS16]
MPHQFSLNQTVRKPAVTSKGGIVASQSRRAAEVGAQVLAAGGDCVDAVVATTMALNVLEPWNSGIGGGGAMVLFRAKENRYEVIDYGMCAPQSLRVADYPLSGEGAASDLFPWPRVKDDRNIHGPGSIAVPGVVAGMEEAHRRYAKMPWKDLVAPAARLAGEGLLVDWWTTVTISGSAADLRRYPASAAAFLKDGLPPSAPWGIKAETRLPQDTLKATLSHLAEAGPRDFYHGDLARSIASDVKADGGSLSVEDLAAFRAHVREPLAIPYRGGKVYATPELTAGPTMAHALRLLQLSLTPAGAPDAAAYAEYAIALQAAFRERLKDMGDADGKRSLGAEYLAPACTTHFSVVDRHGNIAAVTQTLLSSFGSRYVTPHTGIAMNNGIMWFDPTPGTTNSLAPGQRCLCNYTPVIAETGDGKRLAVGASGGRRILPSVLQLVSFAMDYGMDLDAAIHQPRIDASEGAVVIGDARLPEDVRKTLAARFDYEETRVQTLPQKFACPSVVMREGDTNFGAVEIFQPWADAVAEA